MSKLVTIFGGSGFVGRYVTRRMAKLGWRVRVVTRRPNQALFVRTYGSVGQVEPILANIRDDASTRAAILGADAVVNCVGTFNQWGKNNFDALQHEAAQRVAQIAAQDGITRFVQLSAIGANAKSDSHYQRSKALGEHAVQSACPDAVILRPSVIFGAEDQFFNRFARMAKLSPVIPLVGAATRFQPVYVDDVAAAVQAVIEQGISAQTYELGGPEIASFHDLIKKMLVIIRRKRLIIDLPVPMARLNANALDLISQISKGAFTNTVITGDQIRSLASDNVVGKKAKTLADLGISAQDMDGILPEYLYAYRPYGQYTALTESAKQLRD